MRIATLQFAPKVGDVEGNIKRTNELLNSGYATGIESLKPDLLVLPELALTGYNFPSLEAIRPYLEPAGKGVSAAWARETATRLRCKVCVGYPEIEVTADEESSAQPQEKYYNSLLVVSEEGEVLVNYRKTFLFFTDETWASEGSADRGFHELVFNNCSAEQGYVLSSRVATSFGICMDINPYKFEAPFTAWEFANRVLDSKSQLVILSMAWTTFMSREELDALADKPDLDTFNYWIQRFWPLVRQKMRHDVDLGADGHDAEGAKEKKIVIVFGNRCGEEGSVRYAGTSAIIAITQRPGLVQEGDTSGEELPFDVKILCWDILGATTEGICFADTTADPKTVFGLVKRSQA
ncbi:hypothetical protein KXW98_007530 [Aspergillus fumigatus]|uniref:Protein N-terminal asparagine amidohydrolase, putative n=3 Tax=Aspergillus fumigatus TaxID=746128 RepID=Q4WUC9_ASPFU|nr:protein N-terminal asparagine amidohydrolase, putative [Aspergillus fumigatus Af293]EDP51544.1 protein N-terminal asparagine amidohydrolase, putative [Aspergillus fumigatus A1163]KAF4268154.1 hypothetical protein CNMCM8714_001978 [Aspergillus fumigatus]KMK59445.1 protein N-terminal asparagine amidohydrolase [Aspergillus fumigatus Z5]EAL91797.1 protein N-terminal asparagine amidohydrolase, putative [Aspergillus fumigatus Af293]KAF4275533.1 hypothetical protein CNMCM8812_000975 [Aspergillus f